MKKISIIIVTFYSSNIIKLCLNSISQYSDISTDFLEIIIVDNSDTDEYLQLSKIINEHQLDIKLIQSGGNYGYGYANNIGIKASSGKFVVIMNPDIILTEPMFNSSLNTFDTNEKLAMLGYKQKGGLNISYYTRSEFFIPILTSFLVKTCNHLNIFICDYMFLSGAFLFLRKSSFEEIGLFDENIFLYSEESDITQRILRANYKIIFLKSKSYIHDIGDRKEVSQNTIKTQLTSTLYYLGKYNFNSKTYLNKRIIELRLKKIFYTCFRRNNNFTKINDELDLYFKFKYSNK